MTLKSISATVFFGAVVFLLISGTAYQEKNQILVFTKTEGFRHGSISVGKAAIVRSAAEYGFSADTTSDASWFTEDNLKTYDAVVFLNTSGDVLNDEQQTAFEKYIQSGGGFAGVHAAADTEQSWPWYGKLVGGYFVDHPEIQEATIDIVAPNHLTTTHLPEKWNRRDEWYNYRDLNSDINVLATLDEDSYTGGKNGNFHPIVWYHNYDGGRAFYTGGGHTEESYAEPEFIEHLMKGILWATGME